MKKRKYRYYVGDFETTVYEGQKYTEVWASASVELFTEEVEIFSSIDEQFKYFMEQNDNIIVYYHNLKFDGAFWLSYLMVDLQLKQAYNRLSETCVEWQREKDMKNNTFKYSISDKGQWYTIIIRVNNKFIEIRDSLKLLPFSVKRIGNAFKTKHRKLDMEYKGFRYAGCTITDDEKTYIRNDVLVVKEALEIMFEQEHTDMTIGSCCLKEFQETHDKEDYKVFFPDIYTIDLEENYGQPNAGEYIRKSYKGGWCYLVKGKENKIYRNGTTADVNSLYPSMMHSESGNRYPIGKPTFWSGNFIPDKAIGDNKYYFVRIKTRFYIKENMLPFIQIKGNYLYKGTEALETTDVYDAESNQYYTHYKDRNGNIKDTRVTLTLTMTDYKLFLEHYEAVDFEIIDGCWFYSEIGLFDTYINKYKEIKLVSKGALRELAKLFLNNLYGKMASSTDSSFKLAYVKPDKSLGFTLVSEHKKKAGYIPIGSAITSYARNFTIRAAQKNYYGKDKRGFIYADTDSIHCDLEPQEIKGIRVDDNNFCCWKLECQWDEAIFTRQKTYIEHVTHEDTIPVEQLDPPKKPYYNIKCAGMPDKCKNQFQRSLNKEKVTLDEKGYTKEQIKFINKNHTLKDFAIGLEVTGKLRPKRIKGGIILEETTYKMR